MDWWRIIYTYIEAIPVGSHKKVSQTEPKPSSHNFAIGPTCGSLLLCVHNRPTWYCECWCTQCPQYGNTVVQPFNRRCRIYSGFHFLLAQYVPHFKYVKDKMWHPPARFKKSWPPFCHIWIIFTHLKLWIASARHNFKWVKIQIK